MKYKPRQYPAGCGGINTSMSRTKSSSCETCDDEHVVLWVCLTVETTEHPHMHF